GGGPPGLRRHPGQLPVQQLRRVRRPAQLHQAPAGDQRVAVGHRGRAERGAGLVRHGQQLGRALHRRPPARDVAGERVRLALPLHGQAGDPGGRRPGLRGGQQLQRRGQVVPV
ncbi:MAG: hypothetical protein AVDCRST_MAG41-2377, partial [uncultured Corynebacteriales bacterium]